MSEQNNAVSAAESTKVELKTTDLLNKSVVSEEKPKEPAVEEVTEVDHAPAEGDDDAPDADLNDHAAEEQKSKRRKTRQFKERLERVRAEAKAEAYQEALKALGKQEEAIQHKQEAPAEKGLEDFDFDVGAYAEYKAELVIKRREERALREKAESDLKSRIKSLEEKVGDGAWEEITSSPVYDDPRYKNIGAILSSSEKGFEIAHYLATNPDEAERISSLPLHRQAVEVGRLIERYEDGDSPRRPELPVKKVTKAPPPPATITGAGKARMDIYSSEMSTADRIKMWKSKK